MAYEAGTFEPLAISQRGEEIMMHWHWTKSVFAVGFAAFFLPVGGAILTDVLDDGTAWGRRTLRGDVAWAEPVSGFENREAGGGARIGDRNKPTGGERVAVKFRPNVPANERSALHRKYGHPLDRVIPQLDVQIVRVPPGRTAEEVMARYQNHTHVEYAEAETFAEPAGTTDVAPNDPWYVYNQVPLKVVGAESTWLNVTSGSPDVPIGVLDTGLSRGHFEFANRTVWGYDFADGDPDYDDPHGHGTLTAGVIGAGTNNGQGIAAATWENPLVVLRTAFGFDTIEAITWATDRGTRVISMSFGGYTPNSWERDVLQYAFDRDVVLVGAAGNDGVSSPFYPAAYLTVLGVTGVHANGTPAGYNWGEWVDLSAPASGVATTYPLTLDTDGIGYSGGTSIAAPFVAAAAGLVLSVNPDLTAQCVMDILTSTADDIGTSGFDVYTGHGRVNFYKAVLAAQTWNCAAEADTTCPSVSISRPVANEVVRDSITAVATAADNVRVTRVDLHVDSTFISSDTVTPHEWIFDTRSLSDGAHAFWAKACDAAGNCCESARVWATVENVPNCDTLERVNLTCGDGLDNDCDGGFDCNDTNCATDPACVATGGTCDGDGVCEVGEDCQSCAVDCPTGVGAACGNGVCESRDGESCLSCPADCNGKQSGPTSQRFCCGSGAGQNPVSCADARCTSTGFTCNSLPATASCCGDGACEGSETSCNCAVDCGPPDAGEIVASTCRDGLDNDCDGAADCLDRNCATDTFCPHCDGDGFCEPGEDCLSCATDCKGKTKGRSGSGSLTGDRFCCGNGVREAAEGDGSICHGNP